MGVKVNTFEMIFKFTFIQIFCQVVLALQISDPLVQDTDADGVHTVQSSGGDLAEVYTAINDPIHLAISATNAENAHFTVLFGDGNGQTVCGGGTNEVDLTHTYQSIGQYTMDVFIGDGSSDVTLGVQVFIVDVLPVHGLYRFTAYPSALLSPANATFTVERNLMVSATNYTNVTCVFLDNSVLQHQFTLDVSHADDEAVTVWWMLDDTPIHNIKVRCDNLISTSTDAVQVQVHQRLHNIALTVTNTDITQTFGFLTRYVYSVGDVVKFQVSGIGGTLGPHNYTMDFGDGQFGELTLDPHDSMSAVFSHVYTESAYFKQSVTVNDSIGGLGTYGLNVSNHSDPDSGVYVYDIDLQSLVLSSTSGKTILNKDIGGAGEVFEVTVNPGTDPERVPVEMVCYWWWPGYFITKDVMNFTMATVQNYSVTFQYSVQEINQTLTVECVGPTGNISLSHDMTVVKNLSDVELSVLEGSSVEVRTVSTIAVIFLGGDFSVDVVIDLNGTTLFSGTDYFPKGDYFLSHNFTTQGLHTIRADVTDGWNAFSRVFEVDVITAVDGLVLYMNGDTTWPVVVVDPNTTVEFALSVEVYPATELLPVQVTCVADLDQGQAQNLSVGNMGEGLMNAFTFSHTFTYIPGGSLRTIQINCSNSISSQALRGEVLVATALQNVSLTSPVYQVFGEPTSITVSSSGGELGAHFEFFVPGSNPVQYDSVLYGTFTHEQMFVTPGSHKVIVNVWDITANFSLSKIFLVQKKLLPSHLVFTGLTDYISESELEQQYSLSVLLDALETYPPTNVSCDWRFPSMQQTVTVSDEDSSLITPSYDITYVFDLSDGDNQTVQINCSNEVSFHVETRHVWIKKILRDFSLSVVSLSEQVNITSQSTELVYTECDATYCVLPNNHIIFNVTGEAGDFALIYNLEDFGLPPVNKTTHSDFQFVADLSVFPPGNWMATVSADSTSGLTHTATISAAIQVSVAPFASVSVKGPMFVAVPSDLPITYTLEMPQKLMINTILYPPTNVSCIWISSTGDVIGDPIQVSTETDFTVSSISVDILPTKTVSMTTELSVTCYNLISNITSTLPIQLVPTLTDLQMQSVPSDIYPPMYFATEESCDFRITGRYGQLETTYQIHFGDGTPVVMDTLSSFENFTVSHTYDEAGVYEVGISVNYSGGAESYNCCTVYIQRPLGDLTLQADNTPGTIPDGLLEFILTAKDVPHNPTNVTCVWYHPDKQTVTIDNVFETGLVVNTVYTLDSSISPGHFTTSVQCNNTVSSVTTQTSYLMVQKVTGLVVSASQQFAAQDENITLTVSRTGGTNVTYTLDLGLSTQVVEVGDDLSDVHINVSYPDEGMYYINLTAWNVAEEVVVSLSPFDHVTIEKVLGDLTLTDSGTDTPPILRHFPLPTGELTLTLNHQPMNQPLTVYIDWDFGDDSFHFGDEPPASWDTGYSLNKTYTRESIGQISVMVRAHNHISEQRLPLNVTLVERVGEMTVNTVSRYTTPGEQVDFTVQVLNGSHVTYSIDFGDGNTEMLAYNTTDVHQPEVLNRVQVFRHTYTEPGNYTVTAGGSNPESSDTASITHTIQYPVPDLLLEVDENPVLYPPGSMSFRITRTGDHWFLPNDVTCIWTYSDGSQDDVFTYYPQWSINTTTHHHSYVAVDHTVSDVLVTVSCSNEVTPTPKSSSVEVTIAANHVILGRLGNSGPVLPGEAITWTLDIENYGYDPCFLWTFANISYSVLFGGNDCQDRSSFTGRYDDFQLTSPSDSHLVYTDVFNTAPDIHVTVFAENSIGSTQTSDVALILTDPCYPPTITVGFEGLNASDPRVVSVMDFISVSGSIDTDCSYEHSYDVLWSIKLLGSVTMETVSTASLVMNKLDLTVPARTLSVGSYRVTLTAFMRGLLVPVVVDASMYLNVVPSDLEVQISGGTERLVSSLDGQMIHVDAHTMSSDPSMEDPGNKDDMTWKWVCTKTQDPDPSVYSGYDWSTNTDVDMGNCDITATVSTGVLDWPSESLLEDYSYVVGVELSKPDGRTDTFTQIIKHAPFNVFDIGMDCIRNCGELVNGRSRLRVQALCLSDICTDTEVPAFSWTFYILNELSGQFELAEVPTEEITDTLNVPPNSFLEGRTYKIILQGRLDDWRGESGMSFLVNYPPYEGRCVANITEGYAMETQYVIRCSQWRDDEEENIISRRKRFLPDSNAPNLLFSVYISVMDGDTMEERLLSHSRDPVIRGTYLPIGDPTSGFVLPIYVVITDSLGSNTHVDMEITNQPRVGGDVQARLLDYLRQLKKSADGGDIQTSVQLLSTLQSLHDQDLLPTVLESVTDDMLVDLYGGLDVNMTDLLNSGINEIETSGFYILQLSKLQPVSPLELQQVTGSLKAVLSDTDALDPVVDTTLGVDIADMLVSGAEEVSELMTNEELNDFLSDIVYITGELVDVASRSAADVLSESCDRTGCKDPDVLDSIKQTNQPLVETAISLLEKVAGLALRDSVFGESPEVFDNMNKVVLTAQKVKGVTDLKGLVITTRLGLSKLPYENRVFSNVTADCVEAIGIAFETNPFMWHSEAISLSGPVQTTRLLDCLTKAKQPLQNVTQEEEAFLMETNFEMSDDWTRTELQNTATELAYHRFLVNDTDTYVQVFFDHHLRDVTMEMFVKFEGDPNVNDYDFTDILPKGMPDPIPDNREERVGYIQNLTQGSLYSYVLPRNLTTHQGEYTVGVLVTAYDDTGGPVSAVNYTFYVQFIHCKLWFDHLQTWGDDHCDVQESSTPARVKFKSKVFPSSFGAGLDVGPNTIDFGTVFDDGVKKLLENIHILVTILLFLVIYFTMLPFAVKKDREDRLNWTPLPIVGMLPSEPYQYIVDVYTGIQSNSGTESNVYILLIGSEAETENVQLCTPERKNFKRGSMNRFLLGSKLPLGKITYIHIYHDNSGQGNAADWYLDKVVVQDRQQQKTYLFYCNSWLSLSRAESSLRQVLRLVSKHELVHNKGMLKRRALSNVMEDNLWVSTLFRRNEDHFSRVQRLTTALALVFLSMVSSAMWFGRGDSDSPTDGIQIGPMSFTLRTVVVSIYALLTVLPATLLILCLFMKSKRRQKRPQANPRDSAITPPPPYSETILDVPLGHQLKSAIKLNEGHATLSTKNYSASLSSVHPEIDTICMDDPNTNNNNNCDGDSVDMVMFSDKQESRKRNVLKKAGGRFLPFWCVYIAYFLCFCAVIVSAFFTILYSFEWGSAKSSRWLGSFCLSFVESEGIISPVKAILLAVLISLFCKIPTDHSDEFYEEYRDIVFEEEEQDVALVEGSQTLVYKRHLKAQLMRAFKALFWHVLFMACLILVTFGNRDPSSYQCNSELKNLYFKKALAVHNQADLWDMLESTAIPRLFLQTKYNGQSVEKQDKQYIDNTLTRRLGPPAIRQFRIKPVSCKPVIPDLDITCSEDYKKYKNEDKRSYLPGWKIQVSNMTYTEHDSEILQAFVYDKGDALNYDYYGYYGSYSGRGYVQSLGSSETRALDILDQLIEFEWLDRYTRAVVLEFNVYNANINLFSLVSVLFEFPSVGAAMVKSEVASVKLYRYIGTWGVFNLLSEMIVIIFVIILIVRFCIQSVREGKSYFLNLWNCVEVLKLVFGLGAIAMYIVRTLLIQSTVTYMMNNRDELINFRGVTLADDMFVYLIGFMLFLQILQLAQVFKFNRSLGVFGGTLKHAISDLASFGVVIFIIFMAFLMVNYMYYGRDLWNYRNPLQGTYAQISAMLGHFRANEFEESAGFFGRITFTLFMLTMVFIYINMLVVIIMDVYAEVNSGKLDIGDAHKAIDLLTENLKS